MKNDIKRKESKRAQLIKTKQVYIWLYGEQCWEQVKKDIINKVPYTLNK